MAIRPCLTDLDGVFRQFMACVISNEDLHRQSSQTLIDFQQLLELFRKAPICETSDIIAKVVASAPTARLTEYLEAGGWHEYPARQVAAKLDSALRGLWNHIKKVQALLLQIERCVDRANVLVQSELCSQVENVTISSIGVETEDNLEAEQQFPETRGTEERLHTVDYAHMMSLIWSMLVEDFKMQERIVHALGLDTHSEPLQTYSLMWKLRPFLDDAVVEQALSWMK